jgi:hypothetical protein
MSRVVILIIAALTELAPQSVQAVWPTPPDPNHAALAWTLYQSEPDPNTNWHQQPGIIREVLQAWPFAVPYPLNFKKLEYNADLRAFHKKVVEALGRIRLQPRPSFTLYLDSHGCDGAICQQGKGSIAYDQLMKEFFGAVDDVVPRGQQKLHINIVCSACESGSIRPWVVAKAGEGASRKYRVSLLTSAEVGHSSVHQKTETWLNETREALARVEKSLGTICEDCDAEEKFLRFFLLIQGDRKPEIPRSPRPLGRYQLWSNDYDVEGWKPPDLAKVAVALQAWDVRPIETRASHRLIESGRETAKAEIRGLFDGPLGTEARVYFGRVFPEDPEAQEVLGKVLGDLARGTKDAREHRDTLISELAKAGRVDLVRAAIQKASDPAIAQEMETDLHEGLAALLTQRFSDPRVDDWVELLKDVPGANLNDFGHLLAVKGQVDEISRIERVLRRPEGRPESDAHQSFVEGASEAVALLGERISKPVTEWARHQEDLGVQREASCINAAVHAASQEGQ